MLIILEYTLELCHNNFSSRNEINNILAYCLHFFVPFFLLSSYIPMYFMQLERKLLAVWPFRERERERFKREKEKLDHKEIKDK
jgi:hypothetical protein